MLLFAWIVPGLHTLEFVFGMAHGLGWIAMCALTLAAVRARVIPLRRGLAARWDRPGAHGGEAHAHIAIQPRPCASPKTNSSV